MASWNSIPLEITYEVLGWTAFLSWSISFYPQVILNFRRKSVVGLNFDFVVLNLTKHSSYLIYNVALYFCSAIQKQYYEKYGFDQMIPVAANDVAFSIHAVLLTAITLFQIAIYERGGQKVSKISIGIVSAVWLFAAVCVFVALPNHSWLWLISIFNSIQVFMTFIKYIPQAFMNFARKSTDGFSIDNILLDFAGGVTNYAQMAVQSIDQDSWVNFYGNIGKTLLSLVSIFFDLNFMFQHYVLYPAKKAQVSPNSLKKAQSHLLSLLITQNQKMFKAYLGLQCKIQSSFMVIIHRNLWFNVKKWKKKVNVGQKLVLFEKQSRFVVIWVLLFTLCIRRTVHFEIMEVAMKYRHRA